VVRRRHRVGRRVTQEDGEVIGTSRYEGLDDEASEVEIGWTFIARRLWGGVHNRELKRLMLEHAFGAVRTVVFRVHSENLRSRRAVEKLGASLVATEVDALGRGENVVYCLSAEHWDDGR
jgi:N-acetyltransferase